MRQIATYTNPNGTTFTISLQDAATPPDADYWGYYFVVEDRDGHSIPFTAFVKKTIASQKQYADTFVLADPLDYIGKSLNDTKDGHTPLYWPMTGDWFVVLGRSRSIAEQGMLLLFANSGESGRGKSRLQLIRSVQLPRTNEAPQEG